MRILVVDDEPIERESLRYLVQHHLPEVQVVGEAGSGRQAVELAEKLRPDVVLMDVEMPGLSGLEAIREIHETNPNIRSLVVSAYDYFHFAREAFRLGAVDYLLKPVKLDQMVEVLGRLNREIAQEQRRRQEELKWKESQRSLRPVAEAELVALVEKGSDSFRVRELLELLGLHFEAGIGLAVGLGGADGAPAEAASTGLGQARDCLRICAHSLASCALGGWNGERALLLLELDPDVDENQAHQQAAELARRLQDRVRERTGLSLAMGIGSYAQGWRQLQRSAREAAEDLRPLSGFAGAERRAESRPPRDAEPVPVREGGSCRYPTPTILREVERGKRYVQLHFTEELTLEQVAQEVEVTPQYFSKIFSRVVGKTVMGYLTQVRLEHAREILADPDRSIKDACFASGYNDPNYFSRVFRKVTGLTPTEFRERSMGKTGQEPRARAPEE